MTEKGYSEGWKAGRNHEIQNLIDHLNKLQEPIFKKVASGEWLDDKERHTLEFIRNIALWGKEELKNEL